jgi:molybdenum cofactor biosynthesis enzyme MoaA
MALALVGAEPTTRKDLSDIVKEIQSLTEVPRWLMVVTNGINLGKRAYAEKFAGIEGLTWTIGLNHPDYNGGVIRKKQQIGIDNCIELGLTIKNFTYTLGTMDQLDDVLEEIQEWHHKGVCSDARIQLGVEIGRTPDEDEPEQYLSELVKTAERACNEKGWSWEVDEKNGSRTHYLVRINGITHRFIKWVDVKTIDFEEIYSESWATIVPGKPKSPLLHQVILRDRAVNERKPLFDTLPEKYR